MVHIPAPFQLRDRLVTPERNMIAGPDGEVGVEPKIMQVLCVLTRRAGPRLHPRRVDRPGVGDGIRRR